MLASLVQSVLRPLMAEVGMVPVKVRRELLAARLACTAASQRSDDPLRTVAEAKAPRILLTVMR